MANKNSTCCPAHLLKTALFNHKGTGHKVAHNITTIANIPLVAWFIYALFSLKGADYTMLTHWIAQPFNMVMAALFVVIPLTHFTLELEVVLEDYISDIKARNAAIKALKGFFFVLGVATLISILKIGL